MKLAVIYSFIDLLMLKLSTTPHFRPNMYNSTKESAFFQKLMNTCPTKRAIATRYNTVTLVKFNRGDASSSCVLVFHYSWKLLSEVTLKGWSPSIFNEILSR